MTIAIFLINNSPTQNNSSNILANITNITNKVFPIHNNTSIETTHNSSVFLSQIDPNWFYSASAQSAAAIVGLMGGFIAMKLMNHKIFVKNIKIEISDYQEKINYLKKELKPKVQYVNDLDYEEDCKLVDKFLDFIIYFFSLDTDVFLPHTGYNAKSTSQVTAILDLHQCSRSVWARG